MARPARIPGSVTAAAILIFVYGGLGLACGTCGIGGGILGQAMPDPAGDRGRLEALIEKEAPGHKIIGFSSGGLHLLAFAGLVGAGIGVLYLSQIARVAVFLFILMDLLISTASNLYQVIFLTPVTQKLMVEELQKQQQAGAPPPPFDIGAIMGASTAIAIVVILVIKLAFCLPIMILLVTKSARDAFAGRLPEGTPDRDADDEDRRKRYDGYDDDDDYGRPSKEPKSPGDTGITDRS
jgi:hypothetical protein